MARPRTPTAVAQLTGAAAKNPQRFRDRAEPKPSGDLGDPPSFLSAREKKAWKAFAGEWSWLTADDRAAMVALCQMRALVEDPKAEKTAALYSAYRLAINDFGGTPTSRSKVHQPKEDDEDDPFAAFGKPN